VVLRGKYPIYRCFAEHVWRVCRQYTCGLETFLDEAYGDATGMERIYGDPLTLGRRLQQQVAEEVGLAVSVGLAGNRMLAKIASHSAKPAGVAWIPPGREDDFLAPLPVEQVPGVGHRTAGQLRDCNIGTVDQLRRLPRGALSAMFGQRGEAIYERCRGRDAGAAGLRTRLPKTISRATTFHRPQCRPDQIRGMLFYLLERAMRTVRQLDLLAGSVELSLRYDDGKELAGSRSLPEPTAADDEAFAVVRELLGQLYRRRVALRYVGIVLSRFCPAGRTGRLFEPPQRARRRSLYRTLDAIRDRWGHAAVVAGESVGLLGCLQQSEYGFVLRTPSLTK
jgi:DNA polymerase-4